MIYNKYCGFTFRLDFIGFEIELSEIFDFNHTKCLDQNRKQKPITFNAQIV